MRAGGAAVVAILLLAAIPATVAASDPTFESRAVQQLVVGRDGGVFAAGYTRRCRNWDFPACDPARPFVVRLTPDGRIDRTYGFNGWAELPAGLDAEPIDAVGLQSGGRLVLATADEDSSHLYRLAADGAPDTGFGAGGSVVTSDATYLADGGRSGLAVGALDEIYVSEHSRDEGDHSYAVARYDANGAPDPSFAGGRAVVDPGAASGAGWTSGLDIGPGGAVTIVGDSHNEATGTNLLAARFDADGALDPGYGDAGIVDLPTQMTTQMTLIRDFASLADGGIVVLGLIEDPYASHECCRNTIFALDAGGARDRSFAQAGIQRALGGGIVQAPGSEVLFAGTEYPPYGGAGPLRVRVSRYRPSGALDGSFNGDGTTAIRIGGLRTTADTVASGGGGAVLVGGNVHSEHCGPTANDPVGHPCDSALVVRFRSDGRPDPAFGRGGVVGLPPFSFCPATPTTRCGPDLGHDGFVAAMAGAVSPRARLDGRLLRVRLSCPVVVAATCRFWLNATARKRDRLGARARSVVVKRGRSRFAHVRLRRPVARRVARSGSAIVWTVVGADTQTSAAHGWTKVAVRGGDRRS